MFSEQVLALVEKEADAIGLKGSTAITLQLRKELTDRKSRGGSGDYRTKFFYIAGRVIDHGFATVLKEAVQIDGLGQLSYLAGAAYSAVSGKPSGLSLTCAETAVNGARVSLTRNGNAHVVVMLPHSAQPPNTPTCWVDLFVFRTQAEAETHIRALASGKVF